LASAGSALRTAARRSHPAAERAIAGAPGCGVVERLDRQTFGRAALEAGERRALQRLLDQREPDVAVRRGKAVGERRDGRRGGLVEGHGRPLQHHAARSVKHWRSGPASFETPAARAPQVDEAQRTLMASW
jgi:hypothetical protein